MNLTNKKLEEVLIHFNKRMFEVSGRIIDTSSDYYASYTLGEYTGPFGVRVELNIYYGLLIRNYRAGGLMREKLLSISNPGFLYEGLNEQDLIATFSILFCPHNLIPKNNLNYKHLICMLTTDIIGDQIVTPNSDNWMNADSFEYLNKLPEEFRERILSLRDGDNAKIAIDIGFDIYKWDNDM